MTTPSTPASSLPCAGTGPRPTCRPSARPADSGYANEARQRVRVRTAINRGSTHWHDSAAFKISVLQLQLATQSKLRPNVQLPLGGPIKVRGNVDSTERLTVPSGRVED